MSDVAKKPSDFPFAIRHTLTKDLLKGFDSKEDANSDCEDRNSRAKKLKIKARYDVIANTL